MGCSQANASAYFYSSPSNKQTNTYGSFSIKPAGYDLPYSHPAQIHNHSLYNAHPNINYMSVAQLEHYFVTHQWDEKQILENPTWYLNDNYCAIAKKLPGYTTKE